jgi:hypothetical protein
MLKQIQRNIREGNYRATSHMLNDSLPDDGCVLDDALNAVLAGEITDFFENDDERYEITGPTLDNFLMSVVCKLTADGKTVVLITSYVL